MPIIHPTAIVGPKAEIADSASIGPFSIVRDDVRIGAGTSIHAHCLIDDGARIGERCTIHQGTVVATPPQDLKYASERTEFFLGDDCTIREYCTLNRGTRHSWKSVVGKNCLLMAYAHVAHDCRVGDNVIMANCAHMGGHTVIGDHAIIGGLTGIHQFSHIGAHTMVASSSRIVKDIPPYALVGQNPARFEGLNSIGLRRRGFTADALASMEKAYAAIYYSGKNVSQGVEWIKDNLPLTPEVQAILDFIAESSRGIVPAAR